MKILQSVSGLSLVLIAALGLGGCIDKGYSQPAASLAGWTTGFWYWHGDWAEAVPSKATPDVVFFHAGTIGKVGAPESPAGWYVSPEFPESLPPAREYWFVFRYERQALPNPAAAPVLTRRVAELLATARQRNLRVVGIQLDIDSPTAALPRYAAFLREVRKGLEPGFGISITALLDWFREGTAIGEVIRETDEFVPQFYDLAESRGYGQQRAIGAQIDAAKWAPKFNRFGKRYRIGISTFGRARYGPRIYGDIAPIDLGGNAAFSVQASRNEAKELVVSYQAKRKVRLGYSDLQPGERVQFLFATPESVRSAVESAKQMHGNCAGVVFFRWPAEGESLVMEPDEVMMAAGAVPGSVRTAEVHAVSRHCAAVSCVDLYLSNADPLAATAVQYRIRSSGALEYFVPEEKVPARMAGASEIAVTMPAYSGRRHLLLGRAVSSSPTTFRVEETR